MLNFQRRLQLLEDELNSKSPEELLDELLEHNPIGPNAIDYLEDIHMDIGRDPSLKVNVFSYNGVIGIQAETVVEDGNVVSLPSCVINKPEEPGQLGLACEAYGVRITEEAKEIIRNLPRESGSFAPLMIWEAGGVNFSYIGGINAAILEPAICRETDVSLLDKFETLKGFEVPASFVEFVENL
ncbi:hypothetical protein PQC39_gp084 [Vibrio phage Vp_R1]|uniref:Uncharacterized protein n=1 Tax=Vibrio phage Vp_R1 TaxID=2059867 RepID=A0A2H5BQ42_9CAUD|nr:hypothetical protein PQC39_gp084 [Vibrio phage Vp_R1]AUG88448.1 hypothetical protein VPR_084 [Vibrio phage Vp_R1]